MTYTLDIRAYTESDTVPDINAIINYLQPLGLQVSVVEVQTSPWV